MTSSGLLRKIKTLQWLSRAQSMRDKMPTFPKNTNHTINVPPAFRFLMRCLSLGLVPTQDCECETNNLIKDICVHQAPNSSFQQISLWGFIALVQKNNFWAWSSRSFSELPNMAKRWQYLTATLTGLVLVWNVSASLSVFLWILRPWDRRRLLESSREKKKRVGMNPRMTQGTVVLLHRFETRDPQFDLKPESQSTQALEQPSIALKWQLTRKDLPQILEIFPFPPPVPQWEDVFQHLAQEKRSIYTIKCHHTPWCPNPSKFQW